MSITVITTNNRKRHNHIIRSEDFWFSDGNIVLIAPTLTRQTPLSTCSTHYAFKVHRGQLGRHSEIFSDLFCIPQPSSKDDVLFKAFDGCSWVEMSDDAEDLFWFLRALYDGLYFPSSPQGPEVFPFLSSVLRLSAKYLVPQLRLLCLMRLTADFPFSLDGWDRREEAATYPLTMAILSNGKSSSLHPHGCSQTQTQHQLPHPLAGQYRPRDFYPQPLLVIQLAMELGNLSSLDVELTADMRRLLPAAFYDLSRYAPSKITGWVTGREPLSLGPICEPVDECEDADEGGMKTGSVEGPFSGSLSASDSPSASASSTPLKATPACNSVPVPFVPPSILSQLMRGRELGQKYVAKWILTELLGRKPVSGCVWAARWVELERGRQHEMAVSRARNMRQPAFGSGLGHEQVSAQVASVGTGTATEQHQVPALGQTQVSVGAPSAPFGTHATLGPGAVISSTQSPPLATSNAPAAAASSNSNYGTTNTHSTTSAFLPSSTTLNTTSATTTVTNQSPTFSNVNPFPTMPSQASHFQQSQRQQQSLPTAGPSSQPSNAPRPSGPSHSSHPHPNDANPQTQAETHHHHHHQTTPPPSAQHQDTHQDPLYHHPNHPLEPPPFLPWGHPCTESFYFIALNLLRAVGGIAVGRDADPLFTIKQAEEMLVRADFVEGEDEGEDGEGEGEGNDGIGTGAGGAQAQGGDGRGRSKRKVFALQICTPCKLSVQESCERARRRVWEEMPRWFGLE
ncbi:hypothetical protein D9758_010165 [Tetrapyrgos nigripes]|uniref:BTB domain-containing protein n=1 Tax=Tetrapyrgos nigripes TaxID=182062 RepID=A0A8H5FV30_9AGAR|nr:hypothetical protein D9758_010165 [Tetrapyrgos nigripes]